MKSIEKFYDVPMGDYCGVLMREKTAKKLANLLYKHTQEIKELLASDLSQLEVSDWTLAYPKGEQTEVRYYSPSSDDKKMERIHLIDRKKLMRYCDKGVFIADDMKSAERIYMDWYEKTKV